MPIWSVCVFHIAHVFEQHFRMPANVDLTSNVTGFDSVHALFVVCATKNSCGFHFWIFLHFPSSRHIKTFDFIFRFVCLLRSQISIIWSRNPLDFWFVIRNNLGFFFEKSFHHPLREFVCSVFEWFDHTHTGERALKSAQGSSGKSNRNRLKAGEG